MVDFLRLLRSPDAILLAIAHISLGFGYYTFATFIPDYVTTSPYSMTTSEASLIVSSLGYGSIAGRIIFSGISMASHKATNYIFILSVCVCGLTNLLVPLCKDSIAFYTNGVAYGIALGKIVWSLWNCRNILTFCWYQPISSFPQYVFDISEFN